MMEDLMIGVQDIDFMSFRFRQSKALDIALRLPPLFVMDQLLLHDMGLNFFENYQHFQSNSSGFKGRLHISPTGNENSSSINANLSHSTSLDEAYEMLYGNLHWVLLPHLVYFFVCLVFYVVAGFIVTLNTRELMVFYTYFFATLCAPLSYACNKLFSQYLSGMIDTKNMGIIAWLNQDYNLLGETSKLFFANVLLQLMLASVLSTILWLHLNNNTSPARITRLVSMSFLAPSFLSLMFDYSVMRFILIASIIIPLSFTAYSLWQVLGTAFRSVMDMITMKRQFVANFGINTFLETEWVRLRVPSLLRTFWLARFTQQLLVSLHVLSVNSPWTVTSSETATKMAVETMISLAKDLFTRGAETILALLGLTSIISTVCHYIGSFFYWILVTGSAGGQDEEEKSVASVSAVLFFVLALQTGITSLEPDKRFSRLCKNLCLLVTALFHFIHNMVNPVLMSLSANQNLNSSKHLRALGICVFLVVAPLAMMFYLWQQFSVGTWLLAVTAFCIEVTIKVGVTVTVYALFLYDARVKDGCWESLDDAVYFVKAIGNSIEFCFAVFLFFNGGWILFFESGGTIRAVMMLIHAYCNIWLEAKSGWQTFMKRRTAVAKIDSLDDATSEELETLDDVCAICYQEMLTAKITKCRHFFHSVCLRKWLYVQDTCPLCHTTLYSDGAQQPEPVVVHDEPEHEEVEEAEMEVASQRSCSSSSSSALEESSFVYDELRDGSSSGFSTDDESDGEDEEELISLTQFSVAPGEVHRTRRRRRSRRNS